MINEIKETHWDSIEEAQRTIHGWANETFPGRQPKAALTKLVMEEIPELLAHLKEQGPEGIGPEVADCFILLLDLAAIWDVDVPQALKAKMLVNARRRWTHDPETHTFNHVKECTNDETQGSCQVARGVRHQAVDDSEGIPRTDCCGAPIQSVGVGYVLVRSLDGWHTSQLFRAGGSWFLGACTRCRRNLDGGFAFPDKITTGIFVTGDTKKAEGQGAG